MQRLRAAEHGGERLDRGAHDVVHRLLRGERHARPSACGTAGAAPRASSRRSGRAASAPRSAGPPGTSRSPRRSRCGVEEERQPPARTRRRSRPRCWPELDVGEAVGQRERELLRRRRARLADVVAGHADRVEPRHALGAERHQVADQPQVRARREDPLLLRDVLLEDVGLQRAVEALPADPLPLGAVARKNANAIGRRAR